MSVLLQVLKPKHSHNQRAIHTDGDIHGRSWKNELYLWYMFFIIHIWYTYWKNSVEEMKLSFYAILVEYIAWTRKTQYATRPWINCGYLEPKQVLKLIAVTWPLRPDAPGHIKANVCHWKLPAMSRYIFIVRYLMIFNYSLHIKH